MENKIETQLRKQGYQIIAGVDEAGRGPLAGPVVSAAVILPHNCRLSGLNDSKKLTEKQRKALFQQIISKCLDYSITFVPPKTIDEINILNATIYANHLCIEKLTIKPDFIIFDGRDKQTITQPHQTIIKGDQKSRSIAAASILAKVTRDHLMEHYSSDFPLYNFRQHKGYGTLSHRNAILQHGASSLHRQSFLKKLLTATITQQKPQ